MTLPLPRFARQEKRQAEAPLWLGASAWRLFALPAGAVQYASARLSSSRRRSESAGIYCSTVRQG